MLGLWQQRSDREKWAIKIVLGLLAVWVMLSILSGLSTYQHRQYQHWQQQQALHDWMNQQRQRFHQAQQQPQHQADVGDLLSTVNHSLEQAGIGTKQVGLRQQADGSLNLTANAIDYANVIQWLEQLLADYRITLASLTISRGKQPGEVMFEAVLASDGLAGKSMLH